MCALCACSLCACGKGGSSREGASEDRAESAENTPVPEEGSHGEEDQSKALEEMPTLAPVETVESGASTESGAQDDYYSMDALLNEATEDAGGGESGVPSDATENSQVAVDPSAYQFIPLTDTAMGFTFNYPSQWVNVPGVYTVCYREPVEPGDFPARVAITVKTLVHSPEDNVLTDELTGFVKSIRRQYEAKTFQLGTPNSKDTFLGREAISNTYLAFSGETEVKGFIIGCAIGRKLYVFHFSASFEDYAVMEKMMRYMLNSVELIKEDD